LSLLPIIGHHSSNQHTAIISSTVYSQEFFNGIGQKLPLTDDRFWVGFCLSPKQFAAFLTNCS